MRGTLIHGLPCTMHAGELREVKKERVSCSI